MLGRLCTVVFQSINSDTFDIIIYVCKENLNLDRRCAFLSLKTTVVLTIAAESYSIIGNRVCRVSLAASMEDLTPLSVEKTSDGTCRLRMGVGPKI